MARRALLATFGFDERRVLPSLRLLAYDELVLLAGRSSLRGPGYARLRALEPGLRAIVVDPFDLEGCLDAAVEGIRELRGAGRDVRVGVTGGTRILAAAAVLAAFEEGAEAWYCESEPVRLPVLRGVRIGDAVSPSARDVAGVLRAPVPFDRIADAVARRGWDRRAVRGALRELASLGFVEARVERSRAVYGPTRALATYLRHVGRGSGKA